VLSRSLLKAVMDWRARRIARTLGPLLRADETVLDFGTGDGVVARTIMAESGCSLCGGSSLLRYSRPRFNIRQCVDCRLVFRDNRPTPAETREMYDDPRYVESDLFANWRTDYNADSPEVVMFQGALNRLEQRIQRGSLLDVGCSKGLFLHLARQRGWTVRGIEVSQSAAEYARREFDLDVFTGTLEEAALPDASVDVVTMWDLIEHLEDPLSTLRETCRILKPGGLILILTPNYGSLITMVADALYRLSLHRFRQPLDLIYDYHHNYYFTEKTLGYALRQAGFAGIEHIDGMGAHVSRWQDVVRYPRLLELGADILDAFSLWVGKPYRMIVYSRK